MLLKRKGVEQNKEELCYFEMAADGGYTKALDSIVNLIDEGISSNFEELFFQYFSLC